MHRVITSILFILLSFSSLFAQGKGERYKHNFRAGNCDIRSMTVKYSFRSLLSEPIVNGTYKWNRDVGTEADCLPYNTRVALKVQKGDAYAYVNIFPTVPEAGEGYGYNSAGSPSWSELFCGYGDNHVNECMTEEQAKKFWVNGFNVVDFEVWWPTR